MVVPLNIGYNIETFIHLFIVFLGIFGLIYFLRIDWRGYGLLFLLAMGVGNIVCYVFVKLGFYSYPYLLLPGISIMPFTTIALSFPILVLFSVRYSPKYWGWKIPFYWVIIHIGMFLETWALSNTQLIEYNYKWDFWDSYTWWWIFYLIFEWIGGLVIPARFRKPLKIDYLRYGKLGWGIIHFILILTIFLAGYYLGKIQSM